MPGRRKTQINPLELTPGDPVVHTQHGVGRYLEMVQRTVQNATREYLLIEYAPSKRGQPGDRLFVPMDQLDQVTAYGGRGDLETLGQGCCRGRAVGHDRPHHALARGGVVLALRPAGHRSGDFHNISVPLMIRTFQIR